MIGSIQKVKVVVDKIKNTENYIKVKAILVQRIHPNPKTPFNRGDWMIGLYRVEEIISGENEELSEGRCYVFKGNVDEEQHEEEYTILGEPVDDPKYGLQFDIKYIGRPADLSSVVNQKKFLLRIISEKQVENMYNVLENPLETIQNGDIEALCKVNGVGVVTAERIIQRVLNAADYSKAYVELDQFGLTNRMIEKLIEQYRSPEIAIQKIIENPYILADEVDGIGFKKADEIALSNGYSENNPQRLLYLAQHVLDLKANEGYSYLSAYDFMYYVEEIVDNLDSKAFGEVIRNNSDIFRVFMFDNEKYIGLQSVYDLEENIAKELLRIKGGTNNFDYSGWEEKLIELEEEQGWKFTDEQVATLENLFVNQVLVVSGFGGTGKSSSVSAMIKVLSECVFSQTALSGRAAARMQEITGEEGFTIHRLLGYNPQTGYAYNKKNQLKVDIVIVDEMSMIGGDIFYRLIQAIPTGSKLIMLGDTGQLEAIGVMNILHDLINSGVTKSSELTKPHRQALKSGGIVSGMKIRMGEQLFEKNFTGQLITGELQDCIFNITNNRSEVIDTMLKHFEQELKNGVDIYQLQVLTPKNKGSNLSCININLLLQEIYNPMNDSQDYLTLIDNKIEYEIRVGDKVINRKNNYKSVNEYGANTPIFNGDIGIVETIDMETKSLLINFMGKGKVLIKKGSLTGIKLGYCITTHSFQGSQADVIIYGIDYSAYKLLNREQVYTAISRMKKKCIVCAEGRSLRYAIDTSEIRFKQTFLPGLLIKYDKILN